MLLSAKELIHRSTALYRENRRLFLGYSLLINLPYAILPITGLAAGGAITLLLPQGSDTFFVLVFCFILVGALIGLLAIWFSLAFMRVIAARAEGRMANRMGAELTAARPLILPGITTSLLSSVIILGVMLLGILIGMIPFFITKDFVVSNVESLVYGAIGSSIFALVLGAIPAIILSIWYIFSFNLVGLEGKKNMEALRGSKQLVKGRMVEIFWRMLAVTLLYIGVTLAFELVFVIFERITPKNLNVRVIVNGISSLLSLLVTIYLIPFITAAQTILYLEAKKNPVGSTTPPPMGTTPPTMMP